MSSLMQGTSGAAQARAASAADAEAARLDAQLEAAAKKAALRSLEAQAGTGSSDAPAAPAAPAAPGTASGTITIEKDGNTIVLQNPTAEQLAQVTGTSDAPRPPEGWMLVAMTGGVLLTFVLIVWMVLNRNRRAIPETTKESPETAARMARIENAVESIAVEVERISEGQRFTTRMLSEGAAVPVAVPERGDAVLRSRAEG